MHLEKFAELEESISLNYDMMQRVNEELRDTLSTDIEERFIEGLKRKGFQFTNQPDFLKFIKENCRCENNVNNNQRVYYVNDIPFFLWNYQPLTISPITETNFITSITATSGTYAFL